MEDGAFLRSQLTPSARCHLGGLLASKPDPTPPPRLPAAGVPPTPRTSGEAPGRRPLLFVGLSQGAVLLWMGGGWRPPAEDVVAQVTFEHEAPALDGVEQGLLEGAAVALQPATEHLGVFALGHLLVQPLVGVDLENTASTQPRAAWAQERHVGAWRP